MTHLMPDALAFLAIHAHHFVTSHRPCMGDHMLRATTDRGRTATLTATEVVALCEAGLMAPAGGYSVSITEAGRLALAAERETV